MGNVVWKPLIVSNRNVLTTILYTVIMWSLAALVQRVLLMVSTVYVNPRMKFQHQLRNGERLGDETVIATQVYLPKMGLAVPLRHLFAENSHLVLLCSAHREKDGYRIPPLTSRCPTEHRVSGVPSECRRIQYRSQNV